MMMQISRIDYRIFRIATKNPEYLINPNNQSWKSASSRESWFAFLILNASLLILNCIIGCSSPIERTPLYCPPPPQPTCKPGTFDKVLLDTTFHGMGKIQNHITSLPEEINSSANEYQITFVPDGRGYIALVSSDRANASADVTMTSVQRLYSAKFLGPTEYGPLRQVSEGQVPVPFGAGCFSKADGLFYFSAKAPNSDPDDYDLYAAQIQIRDDDVSMVDIQSIAMLNSSHFDSQPAISPDGTHIYFVSDRPGGYGGTDIWYAKRSDIHAQGWSRPTPLPETVNTECDELSPYISPTDPGTLYFSSNGHATVGGYDLFKSRIEDGEFLGAENLGKPINTASDEIFPVAMNDTAFFWSSNKPGNEKGMDLYTITRSRVPQYAGKGHVPQPERPVTERLQPDTTHLTPEHPVEIIAHVMRGAENRAAAGSDIYVRKDSMEIYRGVIPASGLMGFKVKRDAIYDVGAETEEAFFDVKRIDLRGYKDSTIDVYLHLPDTLVLRINFPFDDYEHPYEFVIGDNGQASDMTWERALDLTAHSAIRSISRLRELLLIGHTDSLGTDAYNERLGFRRATFVAKELEKRGVPESIIRVVSKGREQPVERRPGESDELFRLRSRRVEFIKIFQ